MRDEQPKYRKTGVQTFGVNPASLEDHERYAARFAFNFPLLSDPTREAVVAYRAVRPGARSLQRTVYLIGRDGRVRFVQRGAPAADEILAAVE